MKRFTILVLGVFAFCLLCCSTSDAGPFRDWWHKRHPKPAIERKIELKRRHAVDNRVPSCPGRTCPVSK
jgi:hypothetical protein